MAPEEFLESRCVDCGEATTPGEVFLDDNGGWSKRVTAGTWEHYLVTKRVWTQAGLGEHDGSLCIGCLEKRLGRKLRRRDFTFHVEGYFDFATPRLLDRLED